jgi:hypothetical protein
MPCGARLPGVIEGENEIMEITREQRDLLKKGQS